MEASRRQLTGREDEDGRGDLSGQLGATREARWPRLLAGVAGGELRVAQDLARKRKRATTGRGGMGRGL